MTIRLAFTAQYKVLYLSIRKKVAIIGRPQMGRSRYCIHSKRAACAHYNGCYWTANWQSGVRHTWPCIASGSAIFYLDPICSRTLSRPWSCAHRYHSIWHWYGLNDVRAVIKPEQHWIAFCCSYQRDLVATEGKVLSFAPTSSVFVLITSEQIEP